MHAPKLTYAKSRGTEEEIQEAIRIAASAGLSVIPKVGRFLMYCPGLKDPLFDEVSAEGITVSAIIYAESAYEPEDVK